MNMSPEAVKAREEYFQSKKAPALNPGKTPLEITPLDIEYALRRCDGNMTDTADMLGIRTITLWKLIERYPEIRPVMKEIREAFVDLAESKLRVHIEEGNLTASMFVLRTLGKDRGYTERATVEHEMSEGTARNAAALIEAMRRGAVPPEIDGPIETKESEWIEAESQVVS
jgi:hypothetical protein